MEKFRLNEDNALIKKSLALNNYKLSELNCQGSINYIFFSSNALYYPDTSEEFEYKIEQKDKYEWENLAQIKELKDKARKCIFVRDIYKSWYVNGINTECNNVDSLIELLRIKSGGGKIITVGNSAGGYMAALAGVKLKAEMVYCFSGQFSLWEYEGVVERNELLKKYKGDSSRNQYYDISRIIEEGETPIFYFYPKSSRKDVLQFKKIEKNRNVYAVAFDSKSHGKTVYPTQIPYLLTLEKNEMIEICNKYQGMTISPCHFYLDMMGIISLWKSLISRFIWRIKKYFVNI